MPLQLGTLIPNNGKRVSKKFVLAIDGFKDDKLFYTDTDSMYMERGIRKIWIEND